MCIHFFFNDTATTEIYTLSLHDALPILKNPIVMASGTFGFGREYGEIYDISCLGGISSKGLTLEPRSGNEGMRVRSEEHTSELQSRQYLVCRLLLEKKTTTYFYLTISSI